MVRKMLICMMVIMLTSGCNSLNTTGNNVNSGGLIHSMSTGGGKTRVELYIDNNIGLRMNNSAIVVSETNVMNDVNVLKERYDLFEVWDGIIAVVYKDHTAVRPFMILDLFMLKDNQVQRIFSSRDISAEIQKVGNDSVDFYLPVYDANCTVHFTEEELENWNRKKSELENSNISIDNIFFNDIKDNLILSPIDYYIKDIEHNRERKLYVLLDVYTVGSKTPSIDDRAIIEYKLLKENIGFENIIFNRKCKDDDAPFAYFSNR